MSGAIKDKRVKDHISNIKNAMLLKIQQEQHFEYALRNVLKLTSQEERLLKILNNYETEAGIAVTNKALCKIANLQISRVKEMLKQLEDKKIISREGNTNHRLIWINHRRIRKAMKMVAKDGLRLLYPKLTDNEIINKIYGEKLGRKTGQVKANWAGKPAKLKKVRSIYTNTNNIYTNNTNTNIKYNNKLLYSKNKFSVKKKSKFITTKSERKKRRECDLLWNHWCRRITKHQPKSKRGLAARHHLERNYDRINRVAWMKGDCLKTYRLRKKSPAYIKIRNAIDVYKKALANTQSILFNKKQSPYKVGLDEFFWFNSYTKRLIDKTDKGWIKKFQGFGGWYQACDYGLNYIDSVFGYVKKDKNEEATQFLIDEWEEFTGQSKDDYPAVEMNAFITFTERYLDWWDRRGQYHINYPMDYSGTIYKKWPHQGMKFFIRDFLRSRRNRWLISHFYADWAIIDYENYCKEMRWWR